MQILDDLRREHELIERVLGSLRTWADALARGHAPFADREAFVTFFAVFAGAFHHEREEEVLFPALADAAVPVERGPLAVLLEDHRRMADLLRSIARCDDAVAMRAVATEYSHALWQHIDVENSVLFPECERRLRMSSLDSRALGPAEADAEATGRALIARYPPTEPDSIRGDGCVMCHAHGDTCRGLEREWWNEWEWEELEEHVAAS